MRSVAKWATQNVASRFIEPLRLLRRNRPKSPMGDGRGVDELIERAMEAGLLTPEEWRDLLNTDLIVRGIRKGKRTWLAVEVSGVLDYDDLHKPSAEANCWNASPTNPPSLSSLANCAWTICSERRSFKALGCCWTGRLIRLSLPKRTDGEGWEQTGGRGRKGGASVPKRSGSGGGHRHRGTTLRPTVAGRPPHP